MTPNQIVAMAAEFDSLMFCLVLHDKFGFGEKRIKKLLEYKFELSDALDNGLLTFEDIKETLRNEVNLY